MQAYRRSPSRQTSLLAIVAFLAAVMTAALALGEPRHVSWTYDAGLEDAMALLKKEQGHECLPAPYPLDFEPYVFKLAEALYDSCVADNATEAQIRKYALLAAGSATPAGVYLLPYAASEFQSDALKCVLKSYVDASMLDESEKAQWRRDIDGVFTLNDWDGFVRGVPTLANTAPDVLAAALTETMLSGIERSQDTDPFDSAIAAVREGAAVRGLKERVWDPSIVAVDEFEYFLEGCRYDEASRALERAEDLAVQECKAAGRAYRKLEAAVRAQITFSYRTLDNDKLGDAKITRLIASKIDAMKGDLSDASDKVHTYVARFAEIDALRETDLVQELQKFEPARLMYEALYARALDGLNSSRACMAIDYLERDIARALADLDPESASCREALFAGGPGATRLSPQTLRDALIQVAHTRSAEWWGRMDQIRAFVADCDMAAAYSARDSLLSEIATNPTYQIRNGTCGPLDQGPLKAALKAISAPPHCRMVKVPREIIGLTIAKADPYFDAASLFFDGKITKVDPEDGDKPGTIIASTPPIGTSVRIGTGVSLKIFGDFPEEALVAVPKLVGEAEFAAIKALATAGLAPGFAEDIPADKEDMVPGTIASASPAAGAMLTRGSVVTLTRIGPRPTVLVPSIANATSLEEARAILAGAGLSATAVIDGDIAPEGQAPGAFYASDPPAQSPVEMFSAVTPIRYADLRLIPNVLGEVAEDAVPVVNQDGYFTAVVSPGSLVEDGDEPWVVLSATPSVGTPAPKGTVVTLTVSMPRTPIPALLDGDGNDEGGEQDAIVTVAPEVEEVTDLREIPYEIIGLPAAQAAGILRGADNFFVVPDAREGDAAQAGQTAGTVQKSIPAPGTMARRGSVVQLHVFTEGAPGAVRDATMPACPDPNSAYAGTDVEIDTNNNPDDETYLWCRYFDDGLLNHEIPHTDGKRDGIWTEYRRSEYCGGRYLAKTETFTNGTLLEEARYGCPEGGGDEYVSALRIHKNGSLFSETRFRAQDVRRAHTEFSPDGFPVRSLSYDEQGGLRGCRQMGSDGRMHACGQ